MKNPSALAAGALAALAMYFLDPALGRTRRARVRDNVFGKLSHLDDASAATATDLRNRLKGLFARLRAWLAERQVPDEILAERVKAHLGRVVSHPGAVEIDVAGGEVTLRGPVLADEMNRVLKAVRGVRGVQKVIDRLEAHEQAGNVPALQGGRPRMQRIDILQEHWSPTTRVLAGAGGASLVTYALVRRSPLAAALGLAGATVLLRAAANVSIARLAGRRGPYIHAVKTIHVAAPVEEIFAFWQNFENFPRFMRNVRAVRRTGDASWHWEVAGPVGRTVQWNAEMTVCLPNELIAWTTTPGSQVEHTGRVHFRREADGTRVQVEMDYNPPGAALGHVVAAFCGADPVSEMDQDLMRLKSYFETGKPACDAANAQAQVTAAAPPPTANA